MRTLYLVRHAKAQMMAETDKLRELAPQGESDSAQLGRLFQSSLVQPDRIICSDATRTKQTFEVMAEHGLVCQDVQFDDGIYHASASYLKDVIKAHGNVNLMIIGHNPALSILLNHMAPADSISPDLLHFPTACLAQLQIHDNISGDGVGDQGTELATFVRGATL